MGAETILETATARIHVWSRQKGPAPPTSCGTQAAEPSSSLKSGLNPQLPPTPFLLLLAFEAESGTLFPLPVFFLACTPLVQVPSAPLLLFLSTTANGLCIMAADSPRSDSAAPVGGTSPPHPPSSSALQDLDAAYPGRVPVSVIGGHAYVWRVQDASRLRVEHHICGLLIGTLPLIPQQNVFLGLPLQLIPEEVVYLLRSRSCTFLHAVPPL